MRIESDQELVLSARTFNHTAAGTYGQYLPAVEAGAALAPPRVGVIPGLKKTAHYRSNLGVLNPGVVEATVLIRLYDAAGQQIGSSLPRTVPPATYWQQDDIFSGVGATAEPLAYATIQILDP